MKKFNWMSVLCILLIVLTVGVASARYATTLTTDFNLTVAAQLYTLRLNVNGENAKFSSDNKTLHEVIQAGNPNFGRHEEPSRPSYSFVGWAKSAESETVDFEKAQDIEVTDLLTELFAVWGIDIAFEDNESNNEVIIVTQTGDTVTIELHLQGGNYERLFIPLHSDKSSYYLDPDSVYRVEFEYKGSGTYHNYTYGLFGWDMIDEATKDKYGSTVDHIYNILGKDDTAWNTIVKNFHHFCGKANQATNPAYEVNFNFNWWHQTETFVPDRNGKAYLFLEYANVLDHTASYQYLRNLEYYPIGTAVRFNGGTPTNQDEYFDPDTGNYSFTLKSESGLYERFGFKLPGDIEAGKQYTVSFDFENNVSSIVSYGNGSSYFGFAVDDDNSSLFSAGAIKRNNYYTTLSNNTTSAYSYTFTASSETMYLLFDISSAEDGNMANYKISNLTVTEVSTEASAIEDDMGAQEAEMGESIPDESVPTATLPEGMMPGELDPEIPLPEELGPIVPPTESDDEEPADPAEPLPTIPDPGDIAPPPDEEGPYVPGEAPEETP